ncbi:MAG: serine hydrolase domain-containing protein [Eubacterium sp.]
MGIDEVAVANLFSNIQDTDIYSCVIIKNNKIAGEYYKSGYTNESLFELNSVSKSITGIVFGIAADKGYIKDIDAPISEYFEEIKATGSDYQKQITIRHLLTHTSGIAYTDDALWYDWRASDNWVDYILNSPVTAKPGTVFRYSTGNTHLLSAVLQKATGKTLFEFAKEYLFEPLDIKNVKCATDAQGISDGGNGFQMNVYDMAKIGKLCIDEGNWNGNQIVSKKWINSMTSSQFELSGGSADYGYQWWVRTFGNAQYRSYFAQGHYGQFIFVIPDLKLIIVFTSHHDGSSSRYWQYVNDIVNSSVKV